MNFLCVFQTVRLVNANIRTAKYLAAITLGFLIAVSPWNICTIIKAASKVQIDETTDYIITWLGISNSFWNSLIYGMMNKKFRQAAAQTACYTWICSKRVASNTSISDDVIDGKCVPVYYRCTPEQRISGHIQTADMKDSHTEVTGSDSATSSPVM